MFFIPTKYTNKKEHIQILKLLQKVANYYGKNNFKSKLRPDDSWNVPPVKLVIDESRGITPTNHVCPFDTPYYLREKDLKDALEGKILVPNTKPTIWSSRAFPVPKSDPSKV